MNFLRSKISRPLLVYNEKKIGRRGGAERRRRRTRPVEKEREIAFIWKAGTV